MFNGLSAKGSAADTMTIKGEWVWSSAPAAICSRDCRTRPVFACHLRSIFRALSSFSHLLRVNEFSALEAAVKMDGRRHVKGWALCLACH